METLDQPATKAIFGTEALGMILSKLSSVQTESHPVTVWMLLPGSVLGPTGTVLTTRIWQNRRKQDELDQRNAFLENRDVTFDRLHAEITAVKKGGKEFGSDRKLLRHRRRLMKSGSSEKDLDVQPSPRGKARCKRLSLGWYMRARRPPSIDLDDTTTKQVSMAVKGKERERLIAKATEWQEVHRSDSTSLLPLLATE